MNNTHKSKIPAKLFDISLNLQVFSIYSRFYAFFTRGNFFG